MVGRFCGDDPHFGDFQSDWVPFLYLNTIRLTPFSAENISLSLSHLVPEILRPKVGLFHQNAHSNRFKAFCINFILRFQSNYPPPFFGGGGGILDLFYPSFSQNLRSDDWVQFFFACWTQLLNTSGGITLNMLSGFGLSSVIAMNLLWL